MFFLYFTMIKKKNQPLYGKFRKNSMICICLSAFRRMNRRKTGKIYTDQLYFDDIIPVSGAKKRKYFFAFCRNKRKSIVNEAIV